MVPLSLVPALALLFFYVSTFRNMCAVPIMAVFYSSLTSWFPGMSLTYFLYDMELVPVAPIITGITLVFTFHMRYISIVRYLLLLLLLLLLLFGSRKSVVGKLWTEKLRNSISISTQARYLLVPQKIHIDSAK